MASFLHVTDARLARRLKRTGLVGAAGWSARVGDDRVDTSRGVFCVPVLPDASATYQWARELRRRGYRSSCAVQFRIPDDEPVFVGHFARPLERLRAAEAVRFFLTASDPRGLEVIVPRAIAPGEVMAIRFVQNRTGWRFYPDAKGRKPFWPVPGEIKAARLRRSLRAES